MTRLLQHLDLQMPKGLHLYPNKVSVPRSSAPEYKEITSSDYKQPKHDVDTLPIELSICTILVLYQDKEQFLTPVMNVFVCHSQHRIRK